jgi:hypothetical protein
LLRRRSLFDQEVLEVLAQVGNRNMAASCRKRIVQRTVLGALFESLDDRRASKA